MLLTCPACSTRYDVPASVLPAEGRIVRCSACRAEWLAKPAKAAEPAPQTPDAAPQAPTPARQAAPDTVTEALRPVPPLPTPAAMPPVAAPPRAPMAGVPSPDARAASADTAWTQPAAAPREAAESDAPLNASANASAPPSARALAETIEDEPEQRGGTGFLMGFATVTMLALLAVTIYLKHEALAAALPALAGPLADYVALVDLGRAEIARLIAEMRR